MANSSDEFSKAIDEEVTCPVCLEELKEPKMLPCSHNICRGCLAAMYKNNKSWFKSIVCPECRHPIEIPKGGVGCLPTNAAIVRVVEAALSRKAKIEMSESLATGKPMVELLARKISDFDKPLGVLKEIHEKADKLVDVIRNQEESLCRKVEEYYGIKSETINEEKTDLDKLHSSASKSVQEAETILKQTLSDSTKTIGVAKVLKEQIEQITELQLNRNTSTRDKRERDLQFEINAEANISSIIGEKFGKLTTCSLPARPNTLATAAHYSSSSETQSGMTTAASKSEVMSERYSENCIVCRGKATLHCLMCKKRSCESCSTIVTKLRCDSYTDKHYLAEGTPSTRKNEKTDLGSKDVCSSCGVRAASKECNKCDKKSCFTCATDYNNDIGCDGSGLHYFVSRREYKSTSEIQETASQKQTTLFKGQEARGVNQVAMPKTGGRKCQNCTYLNEEGATVCEMCFCTVGLDNPEFYI